MTTHPSRRPTAATTAPRADSARQSRPAPEKERPQGLPDRAPIFENDSLRPQRPLERTEKEQRARAREQVSSRSGGIGRRARLRAVWGNPCRFESDLRHHLSLRDPCGSAPEQGGTAPRRSSRRFPQRDATGRRSNCSMQAAGIGRSSSTRLLRLPMRSHSRNTSVETTDLRERHACCTRSVPPSNSSR